MSVDRAGRAIPTLSRRERPMLAATMISSLVLRSQPDVRLTALAAEGSEAAFEAIVQRYRRDLLAYCSRLLLSDSRAEDAVQQALLCAWTALRDGTQVEHLKPWLYRITHNQAISTLRRPGWDFDELSESLSGRDATDAELERRMLMRETLAAVAALPSEQRHAILRTAVEGDSYAVVATSMGVTDTAVRGLVHRARVNLRAAVAAIAPPPLVVWAAGLERRHSGAVAWVSTALSSGGGAGASVGAGAVVIKSAAVLASSAALVGGTVAEHHGSTTRHVRTHRRGAAQERVAAPAATATASRTAGTSRPAQAQHFVAERVRPAARTAFRAGGAVSAPGRSASVTVATTRPYRGEQPRASGQILSVSGPVPTEAHRGTVGIGPSAPASSSGAATQSASTAPVGAGSDPAQASAGTEGTGSPASAAPAGQTAGGSAGQAPAAAGASAVASTSTDMRGSISADTSTMVNNGRTSPSASLNARPTSS
jgi:RNA polymerase sigma factor (sigma-70 family)